MKAITCLFLICLTAFAAAEPGLKLTITPKALVVFKDQFVAKIIPMFENFEIPPITAGGLTVSNFTLKKISLPSEDLAIQFDNNSVAIASSSFGIQAKFHIDYTLWGFIPISTTIDCTTNKSTVAIALSVEDTHFVNVKDFKAVINGLNVRFPDAFLGPVYHGLIYVLSWPIEYILGNIITSNVKVALQKALDDAVAQTPGFIVLPNSSIGIDYQVTNKPKVTPNYMTIYINGTFYDGNRAFAVPPVVQPRAFPEFDEVSGQHIQAFVSGYVFNTALYEVYKKGMLAINVTNDMMPPEAGIKFGTKWLSQFIPNIENYFNASDNVTMGLRVASNPLTNITKDDMKIFTDTELSFYYVNGSNITTIIKLEGALELHANITLANWTLKPYITSASFGKFTVITSNVGEVTGDRFQQGFNILFLFATGGFNAQFQPIQLPSIPMVNLETAKVSFEEGHIRIQTSPTYFPSAQAVAKKALRA